VRNNFAICTKIGDEELCHSTIEELLFDANSLIHSESSAFSAAEFISSIRVSDLSQPSQFDDDSNSIMGRKQDAPTDIQESVEEKGLHYTRLFLFCWSEGVTPRFYVSI
jgi:hypothetical protein